MEDIKLKSIDELREIRDRMKGVIELREEAPDAIKVVVSMATCGIIHGARGVLNAFAEEVAAKDLVGKVMVTQSGCIGLCKYEPTAEVIYPDGTKTTYIRLTPEKAKDIIDKHIIGGEPVAEYKL